MSQRNFKADSADGGTDTTKKAKKTRDAKQAPGQLKRTTSDPAPASTRQSQK